MASEMATYQVRHLNTGEEYTRPWILMNPHCRVQDNCEEQEKPDPSIEAFHKSLSDYNETTLHHLPSVASELGIKDLFLKDESTRFGLPAFKTLGASYAVHRVVCKQLGLPPTTSLEQVRIALADLSRTEGIQLVTCSEGNWGRAVARMSSIYGIKVVIYVPYFMSEYTQGLIRGEGAEVIVLEKEAGSYDDSIAAVQKYAAETGALMAMDVAWEGYEEVPGWVTSGYSTMLYETSRQLAPFTPNSLTHTFVSIGVGSWAHSVVAHFPSPNTKTISVEPTTAASLKESLHVGQLTPIETGETIMAGMNCGTTSTIAWPKLRDGVHAALTVTDREAHEAVEELKAKGVNAGPCGAATLAGLRKFVGHVEEEERKGMVVILFSTEGGREYEVPG